MQVFCVLILFRDIGWDIHEVTLPLPHDAIRDRGCRTGVPN